MNYSEKMSNTNIKAEEVDIEEEDLIEINRNID